MREEGSRIARENIENVHLKKQEEESKEKLKNAVQSSEKRVVSSFETLEKVPKNKTRCFSGRRIARPRRVQQQSRRS